MMSSKINFEVLAEDNIRIIKVPEQTFRKPVCVVLVGYPGSGKSFLAKKIKNEVPLAVFSENGITEFLAPRATVVKRDAVEVFQLALKTIEHLLVMKKACFYDGNIKTKEQRQLIKKVVEEQGGQYLLIYLSTPKKLCYERIHKQNLAIATGESKGFILDKDLFEYEVATTSTPSTDEIHFTFNGKSQENLVQTIMHVNTLLKAS